MRRIVWVVVAGFLVGCNSSSGTKLEVNVDAGDAHSTDGIAEAGVQPDGSDGGSENRGLGGASANGGSGAGGVGGTGSAGSGAGGAGSGAGGTDGLGGMGTGGASLGDGGGTGSGGVRGLGGMGSGGSVTGSGGQADNDGSNPDSPDGDGSGGDAGWLDGDAPPDLSPESGGGGNTGGWLPTDETTNNSVELTSDPIGEDCRQSQPSLRRKAVPVTGGTIGFRLGTAYLLNDGLFNVVVGIPVTNTGNTMRCLSGPSSVTFRSSNGDSLGFFPVQVWGSVGDTGGAQYASSCLGPGEAGLIFSAGVLPDPNDPDCGDLDLFPLTASLALTLDPGVTASPPTASVVPFSAVLNGNGLTVSVRNIGTSAARIQPPLASHYLVTDDQGLPVMLSGLGNPSPGEISLSTRSEP